MVSTASAENVIMKFLLLGLCLGLALATPDHSQNDWSNSRIQEVSYRPGREYLYQYDTQVMTGLTHTSKIQAGFRISCLARVQFHTQSKVRVQFEKIVLYRINEPVLQWKASERLMPEEFLKELTGDEASTMEHFLQIPFGFEYEQGQIHRIHLEDQETNWSANIKRGFTSLLEMNLEKRFLMDDSFPSIQSQTPPHANWYNVFERSTTGDCATLYTVTPNADNDHLYVTKTRDNNRCLNKPVHINSIWDGEWTHNAQKDNPLMQGATLKYSVRGNDRKFLILSVVGEGHIVFTPYKNQEQVRTSLNQTLSLKESHQISQEIPEIQPGQHQRDSLRMTLPSSPVDCQDPFMPCQQEKADIYSVDKIYLHLQMAAKNTREITSEESLQHLRTVQNMLKTSPQPILKKLWEKLYMSKVNPQADIDRLSAEIYWNVLPNVGTEAAAHVILDVCAREFLMTNNCTSAIRNLALKVTPTSEITDKLIKLVEIRRLTREVRQAAYLALGSYGYKLTRALEQHTKHCQHQQKMIDTLLKDNSKDRTNLIENEKKKIEERCNNIFSKYHQMEEKILSPLKQLLEKPEQEDKILALKALGNSGMPGTLPILRRFIKNNAKSNILRVSAITAHRRIEYPQTARQEAIKTLLKLYLTTTETSEIRQFAFLIMANLKPDLPIYETVAMSLRHEKDAQLSAFVYGYLKTYSASTYNPDMELKRNMTAALKFAPEIHNGLDQSFIKKLNIFSEDYKRGGDLSFTMLGDMARYSGAAVNLDTYNYGLISNLFEIGINTEGLSPFFNKLFGPRGLLTHNKSLFDLLKRGPRDISPQKRIQQIFNTLRIKERNMPTPYGHIYYKMMGHELGYYDFTNMLKSVSTTGQYSMSWNEEELSMGLPLNINSMYDRTDFQMTLPTEAGLPIALTLQALTSVNIHGDITLKVTPYMLESDRQGQPPVAVHAKIDLKPKIVAELQCSMGLDLFYVKPVVGYRGLIKYNAPIVQEVKVDLSYRRLNLKWYNPIMEKPAIEMLLEPFSEFMLINKNNESPVFVFQRRNIYAPTGTRVMPISHKYNLNALGYQLSITGQLPYCLSKSNPLRPLNGRSLINLFWTPMENAPSTFNFYVQDIRPMEEAVANSYAQTYQEVLTRRPEQYGRDFSQMDQSGVQKFDKFGRPLPQSPEEILPYSDPVNIHENPINMQQMCNKFQRLFHKAMPFYNQESARGLIFLLDASSKDAKRQMQLETVWNYFNNGHIGRVFTRMWRSAIPQYDTQEWQMLSELGVSYPMEVKEPKDIFDPKWQRELMKDLEHLLSLETHKVMNQGINMTILSGLEQFNYPAMVKVPTFRILESLLPEQLYRLMNMTGSTIYNRRWDSYWQTLGPVYRQVKEDVRVNVDPNFVHRDLPLTDYLIQVLKVQDDFLRDLRDVMSKTVVAHAEMPIMQWINYYQARTVYMIREVFQKALVHDSVHHADKIHAALTKAETNVDSIVSLMHQLMQRVTSVSQKLDREGKPVVVFKPEMLTEVSKQAKLLYAYEHTPSHLRYEDEYDQPSSYYNTQDRQQDGQQDRHNQQDAQNFYSLRMSLYKLSLDQMDFIEKVQLAISSRREFDYQQWTQLLKKVRDNLNILDQILQTRPVQDPVTKQSLLLVTVQNQFVIELLEQWKNIASEKMNLRSSVERMERFSSKMEAMKEQGVFLGERVSMFYRRDLMQRVVVPNLNQQEYPIYRQIAERKRVMIPEYREFHRQIAYNFTNMKKPELVVAYFDKFCERLTTHTNKIAEIERALIEFGQIPKLYLVSELMDALHYLKFTTEFGSRTLYSINDELRLTYLEKLSQTATKVQSLISALSPIFTKYEQQDNEMNTNSRQSAILDMMPIDTRVLDVQDVLVQQKMLKEQIRRFIQNPAVSNEVLSKVLNTAIDRCEMFQETLKQNQVQVQEAIKQRNQAERQIVSALWTQALTQQHSLFEAMLNIYNNNRNGLNDVIRSTDRINSLNMEVAQMDTEHQQNMDSYRNQDSSQEYGYNHQSYSDAYRNQQRVDDDEPRQQWMQPLTPFEYLPNGVTALWNMTWGNGFQLNKNAKIQFMASRSVEQIMYLFRQMNAVLRSQDVADAINLRLGDEPWATEGIMEKFNSFNHWHFIAQAQKEQLPEWMLNKLRYVQDFFKATYWNEYRRQPASKTVSQNQFQAMVDVSNVNNQWDLYLLNDAETNIYQGLQLWRWAQNFPVIQTYRPLREKVMSYFTYNHKPTQCMVNKDKVYTFDNVNYQLPYHLTQKEALLAADCTDDKTFAVTIIKSNTSFDGHIVKIMNEDKMIEVIPGYLDTEVKVNGKVIVLDENKPVVFSKRLNYDLYQPSLKIVRKGLRVEVSLPLTGIHFSMEGTYMQIKVSELYKRRVCGLCSNFDSQVSWEFQGPRQEIYSSPRLFAQAYILHEEDRHAFNPERPEFTLQHDKYYDVVSHYRPRGGAGKYEDDEQNEIEKIWSQHKTSDKRQPQQPWDEDFDQEQQKQDKQNKDSKKPEGCPTQPETVMKTRKRHRQVCFSEEPVHKCPTTCQQVQHKKQKVIFVCMDINEHETRQLSRSVSHGPIHHMTEIKGERITRTIKTAIRCQQDDLDN